MNDFYTFIVLSTINCSIGVFNPTDRFMQTIDTIESIRAKVPNSKIVFMDNSNNPIDKNMEEELRDRVDVFLPFTHNIFTKWVNDIGSKGIGECYMWFEVIEYLQKNNLVGKRVFKLSGRYKLAEGFDIEEYEKSEYDGKYTFRINPWEVSSKQWEGNKLVWYFETRLYSFPGELLEEYKAAIFRMFHTMITSYGDVMCNWEMNHFMNIPHEKVKEMKPNYVEGLNAENGVYRFE